MIAHQQEMVDMVEINPQEVTTEETQEEEIDTANAHLREMMAMAETVEVILDVISNQEVTMEEILVAVINMVSDHL